MKIAIVDDNVAIQEILKDIVSELGHVVEISGSISDAVDMICSWEPQIVILDSTVNNTDGLQVLSRVRERKPEQDLNVILLKTTNEEAPTDNPFIKAVVNKPLKSKDIPIAIETVIDKKESEKEIAAGKAPKSGSFLSKLKRSPKKQAPSKEHISVDNEAIVAEYLGSNVPMFGRSYVFFEDEPNKIHDFINIFNTPDYSTMVISSDNPKAVKQSYGRDSIDVVTLTSNGKGKSMDIRGLGTLMIFIRNYVQQHDKPIVLIENFTDIVDSNTLNKSLVFLQELVQRKPGERMVTFVVSLDTTAIEEFSDKDRNFILGDMSVYSN
jgi:CheY-like chemotaxis protein